MRQHLVLVLQLDAESPRRQHLDDPALKLYVFFASHEGGPKATRSPVAGQIENSGFVPS
jgi:hypothetical protein